MERIWIKGKEVKRQGGRERESEGAEEKKAWRDGEGVAAQATDGRLRSAITEKVSERRAACCAEMVMSVR